MYHINFISIRYTYIVNEENILSILKVNQQINILVSMKRKKKKQKIAENA